MVHYASVKNVISLVVDMGPEAFLAGLTSHIEEDFKRWEQYEKAPRIASHSKNGVIELMPASDGVTYGFKLVNGHPKNTASGLQTVTALGVLSDVATGYPTFISEMTLLTALRTASPGGQAFGAPRRQDHGDDRLGRPVGIPNPRLQADSRH